MNDPWVIGGIVIDSSVGSKGWLSVSRVSESICVILYWVGEDSLNGTGKSRYDRIVE